MEGLYEREGSAPLQHLQTALTDEKKKAGAHASGDSLAGVVWTPSMRRMYTLLDRYLHHMLCTCVSDSLPVVVLAVTTSCPVQLSRQLACLAGFVDDHTHVQATITCNGC